LKGTHDTILEPILRKFPEVVFKDIYFKGYFAFYHGDKKIKLDKELKINKKIKTIMKGHLHPAVVLKKGAKSETYKCFLVGKEKGKRVIILPSFLTLNIGSDISGFKEYKEFNCYIVGEKVYNFGKLKEIGKLV